MEDPVKKQRDTKQRRIVLEAVMKNCGHPNADEIYNDVRLRDGRISKGTVYRNLGVLSENGSIMRVAVPGADRFDSKTQPHYHVICTVCGTVIDAPLEYIPDFDVAVAEKTGFRISKHATTFEGICPDCAKKLNGTDEAPDI